MNAAITLRGRWLHLGPFEKASHVIIHFPDEVTTHRDIIYSRTPGRGYYGPLPADGPTQWEETIFTTWWRGNAVIDIDPQGSHQPNFERRNCLKLYTPRYTAEKALDPVVMSPLESTDMVRKMNATP